MISTAQGSIVPKGTLANIDVRPRIQALRRVPGPVTSLTADAIESLQQAQDTLTRQLSSPLPALTKFEVADEKGALITWIGSKIVGDRTYQGLWSKRLYIGGDDASTAPIFADANGEVVIGKNGSLSIQNTLGTEKGYLGVKTETPLVVSAAVNDGTGLVKVTTTVAHTYVTGDAVIANLPGVGITPFPPFDAAITVIDNHNFTLNGSAFAGAYTTGGTVYRYYGGIWAQTAAFGGTGFADASIRAFADGHLGITNAFVDLSNFILGVGGNEVVLSPAAGGAAVAGMVIYTLNATGARGLPNTSVVAGTVAVTSSAGITTINGGFINTPSLQISSIQVLSAGRALTSITGISSSGVIAFTGISSGYVKSTGGTLGSVSRIPVADVTGVYPSAIVDGLLAFKADHGTYTTSSALAGASAHTHTVSI